MAITTVSSREFNHDMGRAKIAARNGPVFIADRGRPGHDLNEIAGPEWIDDAGRRARDRLRAGESEAVIGQRSRPRRLRCRAVFDRQSGRASHRRGD